MNIEGAGSDPGSFLASMFLQKPDSNINGSQVFNLPNLTTYPTTTSMSFIQPQSMNGSLYSNQLTQPHQQQQQHSTQLVAQQLQQHSAQTLHSVLNQQQHHPPQQTQQSSQAQNSQQVTRQAVADDKVYVKRPQNPFILWATAKRADVLKQFPKISMRDANAMLGSMWKQLSDEERRPYFDQAKQSRAEHKMLLSQNPHLMVKPIKVHRTSSGVDTGARARELMQHFPQVYNKNPAQNLPPMTLPNGMSTAQFPPNMTVGQVLNAPHFSNQYDKADTGRQFVKRPPNPYMCFVLEKRGEIVKENPKMRMCDINCILGEMWKMLSEEGKRPYFEQSQRSKEAHKQLLADNPNLTVRPVKVKKNTKLLEMAREVISQHGDVYHVQQTPQQQQQTAHQRHVQQLQQQLQQQQVQVQQQVQLQQLPQVSNDFKLLQQQVILQQPQKFEQQQL
ncbi:unnamed protein product, partial [Mesorhabditis spiculigera]